MAEDTKKPTSKNKAKNKTVSEDLLESARSSLYKLKDYLDSMDLTSGDDNIDKKATTMIGIIEKMGKAFETLAVLEKKVQQEEDSKTKVRGGAKLGLFEQE